MAVGGLSGLLLGCSEQPQSVVNPEPAAVIAADPALLSSRGLYRDIAAREVVERAIEYEPDYALWSDGAQKRRWLLLPEQTQIDTGAMSHWQFPVGTKLFKEFSVDGRPIETRLLERVSDTGNLKRDLFAATFVWLEDGSDALQSDDGVDNANGTEHDVPKQKLCLRCHQGEPSGVLGVSAVQLSRSGTLGELAERGLLSAPPERSFPIPGDAVQSAALGVLHANCGHCHSAEGMTPKMHLRFLTEEADAPLESLELYQTTLNQPIEEDWLNHPERFTQRIVPGDPDSSAIAYRMSQRGEDVLVPDQMPPIATRKLDQAGLEAVRAWIAALPVAQVEPAPVKPAVPTKPAKPKPAAKPEPVETAASGDDDGDAVADVSASDPEATDAGAGELQDEHPSEADAESEPHSARSEREQSSDADSSDARDDDHEPCPE